MIMPAYYNENDKFAAAWLRELIKAGHIADGEVDERSIVDVRGDDLRGFAQCHFFAGIGGWSYALRLSGWPDDRPVWTGSCPCQPLSVAGLGKGHADERHLWPAFYRLISECKPPSVFGEQVASKDGREWFAAVRADLEALGYACGGADLCAAGVGAPHIRQRLYWGAQRLADADGGNSSTEGLQRSGEQRQQPEDGGTGRLADADGGRFQTGDEGQRSVSVINQSDTIGRPSPDHGEWNSPDWLYCRDGKWRPVESGTFPLAHGVPARVVQLRGYGNAIVPQVAATFIEAVMDCQP